MALVGVAGCGGDDDDAPMPSAPLCRAADVRLSAIAEYGRDDTSFTVRAVPRNRRCALTEAIEPRIVSGPLRQRATASRGFDPVEVRRGMRVAIGVTWSNNCGRLTEAFRLQLRLSAAEPFRDVRVRGGVAPPPCTRGTEPVALGVTGIRVLRRRR